MNNTKKVVLIGHFGVGKSSLIKRFVENVFSDNYIVTIGVHISKKSIEIDGKELTFVLWDIEGKDDLKKVRPAYHIGTSGFIYVIDPTRVQTYQNFEEEFNFIQTSFPDAKIVTVANKSDLINKNDFQNSIKEYNLKIDFMSSAKTGDFVNEMFLEIGKEIIE